ncbi:hypothetical protein [Candidatus Coxiella mudrowiae]|uniref:hypothetical protein n=1 Tax=Candidatus Coxiella mudrowiae TaxID=2054173 RepID=UPI001FD0E93B|nr:hypothetical protein [Candidatus Coxiella mudrowiae]
MVNGVNIFMTCIEAAKSLALALFPDNRRRKNHYESHFLVQQEGSLVVRVKQF